jgi:catechol 2,3-dioxygenase-like lactoylglutathione lyase family enzyme
MENAMPASHFILLYVDQPEASARFYARLLGRPAIESSPTFAMFALDDGLMLGLWSRHTVQPAATSASGASELAFVVGGDAEVDAAHVRWRDQGLTIAQPPIRMDFGYTCVGLDPDGHRLRAFAPG